MFCLPTHRNKTINAGRCSTFFLTPSLILLSTTLINLKNVVLCRYHTNVQNIVYIDILSMIMKSSVSGEQSSIQCNYKDTMFHISLQRSDSQRFVKIQGPQFRLSPYQFNRKIRKIFSVLIISRCVKTLVRHHMFGVYMVKTVSKITF